MMIGMINQLLSCMKYMCVPVFGVFGLRVFEFFKKIPHGQDVSDPINEINRTLNGPNDGEPIIGALHGAPG